MIASEVFLGNYLAPLLAIAVIGIWIITWIAALQFYQQARLRQSLALKVKTDAASVAQKLAAVATYMTDKVATDAKVVMQEVQREAELNQVHRARTQDALELIKDIDSMMKEKK